MKKIIRTAKIVSDINSLSMKLYKINDDIINNIDLDRVDDKDLIKYYRSLSDALSRSINKLHRRVIK